MEDIKRRWVPIVMEQVTVLDALNLNSMINYNFTRKIILSGNGS